MQGAFQPLADFHTLTGISTDIVTVESVCAGGCIDADPRHDTAKAVKAYLQARSGLKYVILGGDAEIVPTRWVHDSYTNPFDDSYDFDEDFVTDYYYSDLSEWDANHDGVYAEDGVDAPTYVPSLAVARIPASTPSEAAAYIAKVESYDGMYPVDRTTTSLVVSDVAAEYLGVSIDSAWYLESQGRSLSLLPYGFTYDKLYATVLTPDPIAPALTTNSLKAAIAAGYNLIVHNGHGSEDTLIYTPDGELNGDAAAALTNTVPSILLSCACLAASFNEPDRWLRTDAAGERLVLNPHGGAIAYLGSTATGLGLAGGSQFIDEILRFIQSQSSPLLADALLAAHENMPASDAFEVPYVHVGVPIVDQAGYEWSQKASTLLGDPLLPVWTSAPAPMVTLTLSASPFCAGTRLTFHVSPAESGIVRFYAGRSLYEVPSIAGTATAEIRERPTRIRAAFYAPGRLYNTVELAVP